jgi:hypothetical protein
VVSPCLRAPVREQGFFHTKRTDVLAKARRR